MKKKKIQIAIEGNFVRHLALYQTFLEMIKYFQKLGSILLPHKSQSDLNYRLGFDVVISIRQQCRYYDDALFTHEMIWGKLRSDYPNLTPAHTWRVIKFLIELEEVGDCGVVNRGDSNLRILRNVRK